MQFAQGKFGKQIVKGFDFAVDSNIPAGGGASSSSALVVLGGVAIREANGISFSAEELATDSAMAEWFIGTRGGSMDHTTICLAQSSNAVLISYSPRQTRRVSLPGTGFQWITFFSKPADKGREVMIEYNERAAVSRFVIPAIINSWEATFPDRHRAWHEAIESFSNSSLEAIETLEGLLMNLPETIALDALSANYPKTFSELGRSFPALLVERERWPLHVRTRAFHHLGEIKRVAVAAQILDSIESDANEIGQNSAMRSIGRLLNESHESLRDLYDVSTDEVERLVRIIRSDPNLFGARLMGGGFGGNVLALTTKENSRALIERVQKEYYEPQDRDGVREGSIMVSTPGDGMGHLGLDNVWREAIEHINSLGSDAATYATNIRSMIDALPNGLNPDDVWPVIVAAGKGSRAAATGLTVHKPVALIGTQPSIVHVLRNIRAGLGQTRPPVIIISRETEPSVRKALEGEEVLFVLQPESLGTGDAVLRARERMTNFGGLALVVWSTQPVIRPSTFKRTVKLARLFGEYEMVVPTAFRHRPYAPVQRNERGQVESATETHLEGAKVDEFGETNIGLFVLKNQTMFEVLVDLKSCHWDDSLGRYNRPGGELGFPNELINTLAQTEAGVFACPIADSREEQGIKKLADVALCERFVEELDTAKPVTDKIDHANC